MQYCRGKEDSEEVSHLLTFIVDLCTTDIPFMTPRQRRHSSSKYIRSILH